MTHDDEDTTEAPSHDVHFPCGITVGDNASVTEGGEVRAGGGADIQGDTQVGRDLRVGRNVNIGNKLVVQGHTGFRGEVIVSKNAEFHQHVWASKSVTAQDFRVKTPDRGVVKVLTDQMDHIALPSEDPDWLEIHSLDNTRLVAYLAKRVETLVKELRRVKLMRETV